MPEQWTYIGDVCVGVITDCTCPPMIADDLEAEANYWIPNRPHDAHDLITPVFEDDLPEGWTMEKWQKACKLVAAAPELFGACAQVAEYADCQDAADWKDAFKRLTSLCKSAIAKATTD